VGGGWVGGGVKVEGGVREKSFEWRVAGSKVSNYGEMFRIVRCKCVICSFWVAVWNLGSEGGCWGGG